MSAAARAFSVLSPRRGFRRRAAPTSERDNSLSGVAVVRSGIEQPRRPEANVPDTLATAAHGIGRQREALQAATEACDLLEQLPEAREGDAEHGPDEIQGMKAFALRGLAWQLGASGRADQAVGARRAWDACVARHSEAVDDHHNALEREYREAVRPQHALGLVRLADAYLGRAGSRPAESRHEDL